MKEDGFSRYLYEVLTVRKFEIGDENKLLVWHSTNGGFSHIVRRQKELMIFLINNTVCTKPQL